MRTPLIALLVISLVTFAGLALTRAADPSPKPPAAPADVPPVGESPEDLAKEKKLDPAHTKALADALEAKPGVVNGKVYTLTLPRTDLDLHTIQFGDVPVEAGLATTFHVWRCACGKYYILGQYCLTDYESNDVLDSLIRGQMRIASVAPMMLEEKPRLVQIRFQGEGQMPDLIKTLKDANRWIGDNRSKPNPIKIEIPPEK